MTDANETRPGGAVVAHLKPSEIAAELRVSRSTVVGWIDSGELAAVNLARTPGGKRYRVDREALAAFLRRRAVVPGRAAGRAAGRRRAELPGVRRYF
jgi:excisionase family DNA binding protein